MQLKRLWDTDGKKIVYTEWPTWHKCQVWTDENGSLYIYDMAQWLTYNGVSTPWEEYVRSNWVELTDQTVWFYDTNEPTDLYNRDHGDEAYYQFVDWDWTVLKSWTVEEWETPTAPADPTRAATAQYTYTFAGWNPTVGPISKRTTFTATYTATVNQYTATIVSEDTSKWTVDDDSVTADYGTAISVNGNVLTIWTNTITATAEEWYEFSSWGTLPETLTEDVTITATFQAATPTWVETIWTPSSSEVTVTQWSATDVTFNYTPTDAQDVTTAVQVVTSNDTVATAYLYMASGGTVYLNITGLEEWTATITYSLWNQSHQVDVTVNAPL